VTLTGAGALAVRISHVKYFWDVLKFVLRQLYLAHHVAGSHIASMALRLLQQAVTGVQTYCNDLKNT
jgi:hypothetical protein